MPKKTGETAKNAETGVQTKIGELETLYQWFSGENFRLDEATEKYREAVSLTKQIETELTEMLNEIKVIDRKFGGKEK